MLTALCSTFQKSKFVKSIFMALQVEDLEDQTKYRQILEISYDDLIPFILDYLKRKSAVTIFFWSACLIFLVTAIRIRMNIAGYFRFQRYSFSFCPWYDNPSIALHSSS